MSDLDDFFAKKDKKRKNKKCFSKANTEILAKNLEDQKSKDLAELADNGGTPLATSIVNSKQQTETQNSHNNELDDDWLEYANEKKDYSNLKIENLTIEEEAKESEENEEINQDGEKKKDGGPWNKGNADNAGEQSHDEEDTPEPEPAPASSSSSYVIPGKRNQLTPMTGGPRNARRSKAAPDINSQIYFPSLSSATTQDNSSRQNFEEVRGGGSGTTSSQRSGGPGLSLDNKFSALRD